MKKKTTETNYNSYGVYHVYCRKRPKDTNDHAFSYVIKTVIKISRNIPNKEQINGSWLLSCSFLYE